MQQFADLDATTQNAIKQKGISLATGRWRGSELEFFPTFFCCAAHGPALISPPIKFGQQLLPPHAK